jgi:dienelactone hydrolase
MLVATGAVLLFGFAVWRSNADVCPGCESEQLFLPLSDGTPIRVRLYLPPAARSGLPAVVVSHGYLANLGVMEIPWAADLTRLGAAALFLDRRGHGSSGGTWWPQDPPLDPAPSVVPADLAAALAYLRSRVPTIDPERLALLGHSEGGSAAIAAATADWDLRATVAISASAAPWALVNHAVPANLLLIYGAADSFVLRETDQMLIKSATRGYLNSAGEFGRIEDGSARRLVSVAGHGHVGVLHSDVARRVALEWLQQALRTDGYVSLSAPRFGWLGAGAVAMLVLLAAGVPGLRARTQPQPHPDCAAAIGHYSAPYGGTMTGASARTLVLVAVWSVGLLMFPLLARHATAAPTQEGWVLTGLFASETVALLGAGMLAPSMRRFLLTVRAGRLGGPRRVLMEVGRGIAAALLIIALLNVLLAHSYSLGSAESLWTLSLLFAFIAMPMFLTLEAWLGWLGGDGRDLGMQAIALAFMATLTVRLGGGAVERMSVFPVYLVAAVLIFLAAFRTGLRGQLSLASPVMAATLIGRAAAAICARY